MATKSKNKRQTILFLDFDGVLHPFFPREDLSDEENALFSYKSNFEQCIRELLTEYDIKIVISSNWRNSRDLKTLKAIFSKDIAKLIIGKNRKLNPIGNNREDECNRYMKEHHLDNVPWIALDDHPEDFYHQEKVVVCPDCFKDEEIERLKVKISEITA